MYVKNADGNCIRSSNNEHLILFCRPSGPPYNGLSYEEHYSSHRHRS